MTKSEYPQHPPRLLNKKDAAAYCGVSVPTFDASFPPAPVKLAGRVLRWDVRKLDAWIDGMGGADTNAVSDDDDLDRFLAGEIG